MFWCSNHIKLHTVLTDLRIVLTKHRQSQWEGLWVAQTGDLCTGDSECMLHGLPRSMYLLEVIDTTVDLEIFTSCDRPVRQAGFGVWHTV